MDSGTRNGFCTGAVNITEDVLILASALLAAAEQDMDTANDLEMAAIASLPAAAKEHIKSAEPTMDSSNEMVVMIESDHEQQDISMVKTSKLQKQIDSEHPVQALSNVQDDSSSKPSRLDLDILTPEYFKSLDDLISKIVSSVHSRVADASSACDAASSKSSTLLSCDQGVTSASSETSSSSSAAGSAPPS